MPILYEYAFIFLLVASIGGYGIYEHHKNTDLELMIDGYKKDILLRDTEINNQNEAIKSQKVDYEKKLSEQPKIQKEIEVRYQPIYKTIETIKEDKNETCDTAINHLNDFPY